MSRDEDVIGIAEMQFRMWCYIVKTSRETDFIDHDSDVHTEIPEFNPMI